MSFDIIKLNHDSALDLAHLSRETFKEAYSEFNTEEDMALFLSTRFAIEKLIDEFNNPDFEFYGAVDSNGILKGYLKLAILDKYGRRGDCIELARIYILREAYGTRLGHQLMQKAHDRAAEFDASEIYLIVWQENEKAIRFYKKWGFEITGTQSFLLGTDLQDDFVMTKVLKNKLTSNK